MRQKRAKAYRKLMALYAMSFGFRQPYQVLIDAEMCTSAMELKLELLKQIGVVLQGTVKPMITQCCIHELYVAGRSHQAAVDLAKTFERRRCNHMEPIPGDECVTSVVGDTNKHRYVVATQSQSLRIRLRSIPAVPIVHVNRSVMVLEPPSGATVKAKKTVEEEALHLTASDRTLVSSITDHEPPRKRRKGPKGPNPLSVKKKTIRPEAANKDKGKAKNIGRNDSSVLADTEVGVKRKRDEQNGDQEGEVDGLQIAKKRAGGHKRKRQRKAAMQDQSVHI